MELFSKPEYYQYLIHIIPDAPYKIKYSAMLALCTLFGFITKDRPAAYVEDGDLKLPTDPTDTSPHDYILADVFNALFPEVSDGQDEKLGFLVLKFCSIVRNNMDLSGFYDLYVEIFNQCGGEEMLDSFAESDTEEIRSVLEFYENRVDLNGFVEALKELEERKRLLEEQLGVEKPVPRLKFE